MNESSQRIGPWLNFAGCVLVVAVLYWAQAVLIPLALATLLAFILTPVVVSLQKRMGRKVAVVVTVTATFLVLGTAGVGLAGQLSNLVEDLPGYRSNIRHKIADVRQIARGGTVEKVQETLADIQTEIEDDDSDKDKDKKKEQKRGSSAEPMVVRPEQTSNPWGYAGWLGPFISPLTTAGLVIALVIFMLLELSALRGRIIGLIGHGRLASTTKAFDEAGRRVSRQLLVQSLVNGIYGLCVGLGLYLIGVPYAFLWAVLALLLRFVPYVGPIIAAAGPILVGFAAFPGWEQVLWVVALFMVLELITNLVLETVLFAGAAGVSPVALLIAIAFWTWLWGPMGLLMATPLTICVVVLGKHVPGMEFLSALLTDETGLAPDTHYYQRLLARDPSEASDIIDRYVAENPRESVYDALLLPALNYAERDRMNNRLSAAEELDVVEATREFMSDAALAGGARDVPAERTPTEDVGPASKRLTVLAWPAGAESDLLALHMLGRVLEGTPLELEVLSKHTLAAEIIMEIERRGGAILCIADLPPSPPSRTRYLIKKIRSALPEVAIVVGRWAPPELVDERADVLISAGAQHVGSRLVETRDHLLQLARR